MTTTDCRRTTCPSTRLGRLAANALAYGGLGSLVLAATGCPEVAPGDPFDSLSTTLEETDTEPAGGSTADSTGTSGTTGGQDGPTGGPNDTTGGPDGTTGGSSAGCLPPGTYLLHLNDRDDPFGHFPFLKLFYSPDTVDNIVEETVVVEVSPEGEVSIEILPRLFGTGEGHGGLNGLTATMGQDCSVEIVAQVEFESDTGPFGTIDVELLSPGLFELLDDGVFIELTLEGGSIPSGPITYSAALDE